MMYTQKAKNFSNFGRNYQKVFSNKMNFKFVKIFTKNPRFVKPVTKIVPKDKRSNLSQTQQKKSVSQTS